MIEALLSLTSGASTPQKSGCLRVFPAAFLYNRLLLIINYGDQYRIVVKYGKLMGIQVQLLPRKRDAEPHI